SISDKIVVNCHFGFEYEGNHIRNTINIQDQMSVNKMLLQGKVFACGHIPANSNSPRGGRGGGGESLRIFMACVALTAGAWKFKEFYGCQEVPSNSDELCCSTKAAPIDIFW
ncbi:uncharacterized protein VP01_6338g1, partial [Puccinia sorghi]